MKKTISAANGFVLYVVLGSILVVSLIVGGVMGYSMFSLRSADSFSRISECRLAAQSALETAKIGINAQFSGYFDANPSELDVLNWFDTYSETSIGSGGFSYDFPQAVSVNGFTVSLRLSAAPVKNPVAASAPYARLKLEAVAAGTAILGGDVARTIEETVDIGLKRADVFDDAYFADHFGELTDQSTINGSAGSNGDFIVDVESIVNGYVRAHLMVGGSETVEYWTLEEYWKYAGLSARPTNPPGENASDTNPMGYEGGPEDTTEDPDDTDESRLVSGDEYIKMPFIGNLAPERALAMAKGGTIVQGGKTVVNAVFGASEIGPSAVAGAADQGCLVLDAKNGTIYINGPVVIDRDVIFNGKVTVSGQGTIYAGRNVHILGDITYLNPPTWEKPDDDPLATAQANESADMMALVAKGNIVVDAYWKENPWLNNVVEEIESKLDTSASYEVDPTDSSLGYCPPEGPYTFNGDYTELDGLEKVASISKKKVVVNGKQVFVTATTSAPSKFYESLVYSGMLSASTITKIDAVLYSNHAIMGKVGNVEINGSMICRDDILTPLNWTDFNWDIRLGSRSIDGLDFPIHLPMVVADPKVVGWREVH